MVPAGWLSLIHMTTIGNTGVGKSSLCNFLSGKEYGQQMSFPVGHNIDAFTYKTTAQLERWLGKGEEYILVDTPGLGDPSGGDELHIAEMVKELKELEYMNGFLILFNTLYPKIDESLRAMLDIFAQIYGVERFFDNVILIFTRWDHSAKADKGRQRRGETRATMVWDINRYFQEAYNIKKTLPALFIDAYPDPDDQDEIDSNLKEVVKLKQIVVELLPFPVEDAGMNAEEVREDIAIRGEDRHSMAEQHSDQMSILYKQIEEQKAVWQRDKADYEKRLREYEERIRIAKEENKKKKGWGFNSIDLQMNAEEVREDIASHGEDRHSMAEQHSDQMSILDKQIEERKAVWQRDKADYEKRQREYEERIRIAKEEYKKKKGWGFNIGALRVEL